MKNKETILYRIINGYTLLTVDDTVYKLIPPSIEVRYKAEQTYDKAIEENRFDEWITSDKCLELLISNGFVSSDIDVNIKKIQEYIDDLKIQLYETNFNFGRHKDIKANLHKVKEKYIDMLSKRHMFDHLTLEGFAGMVKRQYIIYETLFYYETNTKVWTSFQDIDTRLMERVLYYLNRNTIDTKIIRELARTEPWRSFWNVNKSDPFGEAPIGYTDEQRTLILFSKMYDSAYEHPECPPEDIINDDDMFDGWILKQRRDKDKEKMTKEVENKFKLNRKNVNNNADEVFIIPRDKNNQPSKKREDIDKINSLNDFQGKIIKAQRNAVIKKKGLAKDSQFQDRRTQIQSQANRMFVDQVKGRKGR